jgi:hypothetical protein
MSAIGSRYRAMDSEDVTMDTSVWVIVNCKVWSCAVSKSPVNPVINPKSVYSHAPSRRIMGNPISSAFLWSWQWRNVYRVDESAWKDF